MAEPPAGRPEDLGRVVEGWLALGDTSSSGILRVLLADIDGVLTGGEGGSADPAVLTAVAAWNDAARGDPLVPAVALCTGRQAPYAELVAQLTNTFLPCVFEHGAGLVEPTRFRFVLNPALGPAPWRAVAAIRELLDEPLLAPGRAFVQPGKEASLTLYPLGSTSVSEVSEIATTVLAAAGNSFRVTPNINGVEIRPPGIDKGAGARWLADRLGLPLGSFAGVGDADDDLTFLRIVGFGAAPSNAAPGVRAVARYVAAGGVGDGLLEILEHVAGMNRQAASQGGGS